MADKIKPLKIENPTGGGSETDPFPTETDPSEDYLAAKGLAFENTDTRLLDLDGSGNIQFKDATETTYIPLWKLRRAIHEIFNPTGTTLVSTNTEDAIKEVLNSSFDSSKSFLLASYGGNANAGRYLEFFAGIASNEAPIEVINPYKAITIVARTSAVNATCTIKFLDIKVPASPITLYTLTFSGVKDVVVTSTPSSPLFTTASGAHIAIQVDTGSIGKPHLYMVGQGG